MFLSNACFHFFIQTLRHSLCKGRWPKISVIFICNHKRDVNIKMLISAREHVYSSHSYCFSV